MKTLPVFLIAISLATSSFADSLLTPAETKEIATLIDSLFTAGVPDTKGATVYSGDIGVRATFDPAKNSPPLPSMASTMQMTTPNSTKMTYGYRFVGVHLKLADGSWIFSLSYHFKPKPGDNVDNSKAQEINLKTLTADAAAAHPFNADSASKWLDKVSPAQQARAKAELAKFVPVTMHLKLSPDFVAPAIIMLHRAGWPDAADMSLTVADQRARSYFQLKPWSSPDPSFDPTGEYPGYKDEEEGWKKGHAQFVSEPPATALRRAMFRWFRAQLMVQEPEDAMLSIDVAAACAKACVDAKDPQKNAARIDALAAGQHLPVTVAPNATLIARLQSWEGRPRQPRIHVTGGNAPNGGPTISTAIGAAPFTYTPQQSDLDELVKLLADERPSRFNDFSGPRTLGDNAMRAMATLLKADPRKLANYLTDKPWTSAERKAAAAAVQAWWKEHRKEFVEAK